MVGEWARVADLSLDAQRVLGELVAALHVEAGQPAAGAAASSADVIGLPAAVTRPFCLVGAPYLKLVAREGADPI